MFVVGFLFSTITFLAQSFFFVYNEENRSGLFAGRRAVQVEEKTENRFQVYVYERGSGAVVFFYQIDYQKQPILKIQTMYYVQYCTAIRPPPPPFASCANLWIYLI